MVKLGVTSGVFGRGELKGWVGEDKARTAVREDDVCDLGLRAQIPRLLVVEVFEPGQESRPGYVSVGLHEDEPLGVGLVAQCLLHHGQELPFIQFPARVVWLANGGIRLVRKVILLKTLAPELLKATVDVKVGDLLDHFGVHTAEHIMDLNPVDLLLEIGVDDIVRDTAQRALEMNRDLLLGFGHARLHHNQDILDPGERGTHWGGLAGILGVGATSAVRDGLTSELEIGVEGEDVVQEQEGEDGSQRSEPAGEAAAGGHPGVTSGKLSIARCEC